MCLYTACVVLLVSSIPVAAQPRKAVKSVENIEDIEIGMPADLVIAGLTKEGYTLMDAVKGLAASDLAEWQVLFKDKYIGEFSAEKGRVTDAEISVYDSRDAVPGGGSIELAEALYWIFYDNGVPLPSKDRDWKQMGTDAGFTTREIETRTPGSAFRMIFARMANGANYRITLARSPEKPQSLVLVNRLAPFVRKK